MPARTAPAARVAAILARLLGPGLAVAVTVAATMAGAVAGAAPAMAEPGRIWRAPGSVGSGPGTVVGLGDSVPAGSECRCTPYVRLAAVALTGQPGVNLARGGLTSVSLATQLRSPAARSAVAGAAVTLVTVGANDLPASAMADPRCQSAAGALGCYGAAIRSLSAQVTADLGRIRALTAPRGGVVVVTGYWNVFLDGAVGRRRGAGYVAGSDAVTRAVNAALAAAAAAAGARYADLYRAFKGDDGTHDCTGLLAPDGDHPNALGHQVIAGAVVTALTGPPAVL